jgi:hypothetical protein
MNRSLFPRPTDTTVPMECAHGPQHFTATWPRPTPTAPGRACRRRHPVLRTIGVVAATLLAAVVALTVVAIIWGKPPVTVIKGDPASHTSSAVVAAATTTSTGGGA